MIQERSDFEEIIKSMLNGRCIAFLGAGFSLGATNINDERILTSKQLAHKLCEEMGEDLVDDLEKVSDYFVTEKGSIDEVINYLKPLFTIKQIENHHVIIASVPWKIIYTTNYDDVYEMACKHNNKRFSSVTLSDKIQDQSVNNTLILHINGFIGNLNKNNFNTDFKLTNVSHTTNEFDNSKWYNKFIDDIKLSDAIFFIGYSMYDIEVQKIFSYFPNLKEKTHFIIGPSISAREKKELQKFGTVYEITAQNFAEYIEKVKKTYNPTKEEISFQSFSLYKKPTKSVEISIEDMFNFFIYGKYTSEQIFFDLLQENDYSKLYIKRHELNALLYQIENGLGKNFIIQSDFGNGKTLFIEGLKALCSIKGIDCYELMEENKYTLNELERILSNTKKQLIIIENYSRYKQVVEFLANQVRSDNTILIFTERTSVNSVYQESLLLNLDSIPILLDKLDDEEIKNLINKIDIAGLWGSKSNYSFYKKHNLIKKDCKSAFSLFLLDIIKSQFIEDKLKKLVQEINNKEEIKELLSIFCICSILNETIDFNDAKKIASLPRFNMVLFTTNPVTKHLCNNESYDITIKSPIFGKYILHNFYNVNYLIKIILKMYKYFAERVEMHYAYRIIRELDRFAILQILTPETEEQQEAILSYFNEINSILNNHKNYHYWFQYATAFSTYEMFDKAERMFEDAYSLYYQLGTGEPHRMLDNQYGRFLLKRAIKEYETRTSYFEDFKRANDIVQYQIIDPRTQTYPYRIINLYYDFIKKYGKKLSPDQLLFIFKESRDILSFIEDNGSKSLFQTKIVEDAKHNLQNAITYIETLSCVHS